MAALRRGWRKLSSHTSSDLTLSETDGPALKSKQDGIATTKKQEVNKDFLELVHVIIELFVTCASWLH